MRADGDKGEKEKTGRNCCAAEGIWRIIYSYSSCGELPAPRITELTQGLVMARAHEISRSLGLLFDVHLPQPSQPSLECLSQLVLIVPDSLQAQAQEICILLAASDHPLASRPSNGIIRPKCLHNVLDVRHSIIPK